MYIDQFWAIIEASRQVSTTHEEQALALQRLLEPLPLAEIVAFQEHFWDQMGESDRSDLWDVAHTINGFCSDDGFLYFQAWLIGQGREYFEAALQQPECAADRAKRGEISRELLMYAAGEVYEAKTGECMF
jgi:hypothetical protein